MGYYYKHDFMAGFNFWYLWVPLVLVLAVVIGWRQFYIGRDLRIKARYDRATLVFAIFAGAIMFTLMSFESYDGLVQWAINGGGDYDSAVNGDFWAITAIVIASFVLGFVVWWIEGITAARRWSSLERVRNRKLAEREARTRTRHQQEAARKKMRRQQDRQQSRR